MQTINVKEQREQVIENICEIIRTNHVTFEFQVKEKPKGVKVIYEITQAEMNAMMNKAAEKEEKLMAGK